MSKNIFATTALASLFAVNVLTGCEGEKNTLPANDPNTTKTVNHDPAFVSADKDNNSVYDLQSYKLDSARGLVILNGHDIYQVDQMDYQVSGYWMQMTEEMDLKTNQVHVTGVAVSKANDENGDNYITPDDLVKDPESWKKRAHTEYRVKGHSEFNSINRTKLWRVAPVPAVK